MRERTQTENENRFYFLSTGKWCYDPDCLVKTKPKNFYMKTGWSNEPRIYIKHGKNRLVLRNGFERDSDSLLIN